MYMCVCVYMLFLYIACMYSIYCIKVDKYIMYIRMCIYIYTYVYILNYKYNDIYIYII